jgi:hypothetical protein
LQPGTLACAEPSGKPPAFSNKKSLSTKSVDNFVDDLPSQTLSPACKRLFLALPKKQATQLIVYKHIVKQNTLLLQGFRAETALKRPQGVHDLTWM